MSVGEFSGGVGAPELLTTTEALDKVTRDLETIMRALETPAIITRLCEIAINMIRLRTYAGIGIDGAAFEPYSDRWEQTWAEIREAAGLPTDRVTLSFSGTMLRAISYEIFDPRSAQVFVRAIPGGGNPTPRDVMAEGHQLGNHTLPQREWFGFTEQQKEILRSEATAMLAEILAKPGDDISVLQDRYVIEPFDPPTADYAALAGIA